MLYHYSLALDGLSITGLSNSQFLTAIHDPKATAALFEKLSLIEGFDIDKNGEPVILFTNCIYGQPCTGWCLWSEFVKTFLFTSHHAEIILEAKENEAAFTKSQSIIHNLLSALLAS